MSNFLVCVKCDSTKIGLVGLKKNGSSILVKIACQGCTETENFSLPESEFLVWAKDPSIAEAMKVFGIKDKFVPKKKPTHQEALW